LRWPKRVGLHAHLLHLGKRADYRSNRGWLIETPGAVKFDDVATV
jgi:hypothetical protein